MKAASEIYPHLHGDIVDGGSILYVQDFCRIVCIINLNDYDTPPAFLTLLDQASGSGKSRMEKLQQRLLQGHHASKDSEFVAAITPTLSSLARYHSAASSEVSAALLAVPKTQQLSFPKQAYRVFLRRRFGMAIPQIALRRCVCKSKPELDRLGTHLVCMCPKGRERFITHDSMAICIRDMAKAAGAYAKFRIRISFARSIPTMASDLTYSSSASKSSESLAMSSSPSPAARPSPGNRQTT